jgi:hypothetical protein
MKALTASGDGTMSLEMIGEPWCGAASACGGVFSLSSTLETYRDGGDGV